MNVDLLIKENKELNEEKQRYKDMWFTANDSLAKYRNIEKEIGCPLEIMAKAFKIIKEKRVNMLALMHSIRFENLEFYKHKFGKVSLKEFTDYMNSEVGK